MSKNLLNITYKNTQKLIRENFQEINNIFEEKLLNYCVIKMEHLFFLAVFVANF